MTIYQNGIWMSADYVSRAMSWDSGFNVCDYDLSVAPIIRVGKSSDFLSFIKPEPTFTVYVGRGNQKNETIIQGTGFASPYMAGKIAKKLRKRGKR